MASGKLPVRLGNSLLVGRLLDSPGLPALIQSLTSTDLVRLVRQIGKEDVQGLLVHATPEQITDLIQTDTWETRVPGTEEAFIPERFLEWIELWQDIDPKLFVSRLKDLGSQLLALALDRYTVAVDLYEVGVTGWVETFGRFGVMPLDEEMWPQILVLLKVIWDEDAEFMEQALAHYCQRRSLTVEKTHLAGNENLEPDVAGARDQLRRAKGYITPGNASAFLARVRQSSLETLIIEQDLDTATAMQIRNFQSSITQSMSRLDQQVNAHPRFTSASGNGEPQSSVSAEDLLVQLFGSESTITTPLLNSPEPDISHYLDLQLRDLATRNPEALDSRSSEILYLANLLMEGIGIQGERMTEEQAMNCVSQTCNLGITYCVFQVPWNSEPEIVREFMERRPGLIRAFNIGFKLISELPVRVVSALEALLESNNVKKRLGKDPWIMSSVNAAFIALKTSPGDSYHFHQHLAELLDSLMLFCDASVCEQLRIIGDSFPRFPASLTPDAEPTTYVNRSWQFISTQLELELLRIFLHTLDRHLFGR